MNRVFHISTTILRFVVTCAAKAELSALYHNWTHLGWNEQSTAKTSSTLWQRYSSPHCKQHYQASAFQIYGNEIFLDWRQSGPGYVRPELAPRTRKPSWLPEQTPRWLTPRSCDTMVLTYGNSPRVLPQAERPNALKGCVGTLKDGYIRKVPLMRAPRIQHASHISHGRFSILSQNLVPNCHERMKILAPQIPNMLVTLVLEERYQRAPPRDLMSLINTPL